MWKKLDRLPMWVQLLLALALLALLVLLGTTQQPGSALYAVLAAGAGGVFLAIVVGTVVAAVRGLHRIMRRQ